MFRKNSQTVAAVKTGSTVHSWHHTTPCILSDSSLCLHDVRASSDNAISIAF